MTRTSYWMAAWMLACAANADATCIILIVEKDRVVLAGDGLETHPGTAPTTACKIAAGPHAAVTLAGLTADANTGFDLPATARNATEAAGGLEAGVARFTGAARQALQQELSTERIHAPGIYLRRLGRPLTEAIFAGFEQGRAVAWIQRYSTNMNGEVEQHPAQRITADRAPRMFVFCDAADEFMRNTPELRRMEPVKLAQTLLRYEIDHQPKGAETVGPPVAIVAIRKSGLGWIEPGACGTQMARR